MPAHHPVRRVSVHRQEPPTTSVGSAFSAWSHPKGTTDATLFTPDITRFTLPQFEANDLEVAFDQIELFGFPLISPFRLLTPEAQAVAERGVRSEALPDCIGRTVEVVGYLVTVKETHTARRERMSFGCFVDVEGQWLDTVHFPRR